MTAKEFMEAVKTGRRDFSGVTVSDTVNLDKLGIGPNETLTVDEITVKKYDMRKHPIITGAMKSEGDIHNSF
ncbi:MAG: hypothetical protein K0S38_1063 [Candidatus Paceibacter sp.]|jgi:hypothetical protein|nr:hypothetical protein [Candidatus Paceibacter sp.]